MDAIVYTSETGFTKQYAEALARETGIPAYDAKAAGPNPGARIAYLGWLMAGRVQGLAKARKMYDVRLVCAVGMARPGEQSAESIGAQNKIAGVPIFYLRGGYRREKLRGLYRIMMNAMSRAVAKKLAAKPDKTDEDRETLEMMTKGANFVHLDALAPVIEAVGRG